MARRKASIRKSKATDTSSAKHVSSAEGTSAPFSSGLGLAAIGLAATWILTASVLSSRTYLVMGYATLHAGRPAVEPFLSSQAAFSFACVLSLVWLFLLVRSRLSDRRNHYPAMIWLLVAQLPLGMWLLRLAGLVALEPLYWEALWFSFGTGISFAALAHSAWPLGEDVRWPAVWRGAVWGLCVLCCSWWYSQSAWYFEHFQLGFNDFGQFALRLDNTAAGRGILMETPVLPPFWDHFNPGLLLLVPLWKLFPSAYLLFWLQAVCLSVGSILIFHIARSLRLSTGAATLWGAAWLVQPSVGQMNLAYTYGWHPISLAIPLLLLAILCLLRGKKSYAAIAAGGAMAMNEAVIAVVCMFCLSAAAIAWWAERRVVTNRDQSVSPIETLGLRPVTWLLCGVCSSLIFVCVYAFSGLADFQTGRFVALGDSAFEVILSPVLRPAAFWGELFQWKKAAFVLSLFLPCYAASLIRGWKWMMPVTIPLGLLLVWDHQPASSLAFQYPSSFLPVLWWATLSGAARQAGQASAVGALFTGLLLSLFVGQLPYSSSTLLDVTTRSYGIEANRSRGPETALGTWLQDQLETIREDRGEVLATGRIAGHLLGNRDVETVGQYLLRKPQLAELPDRANRPIRHYTWVVLDREEAMQQTPQQTFAVETEALVSDFAVYAERDQIVVLRRQ